MYTSSREEVHIEAHALVIAILGEAPSSAAVQAAMRMVGRLTDSESDAIRVATASAAIRLLRLGASILHAPAHDPFRLLVRPTHHLK